MMIVATFAIGFLGLLVWGHHMFTSGMSPYSSIAFSVLTMTIGVPSASRHSTGWEHCGAAASSSRRRCCSRLGSFRYL